MAQGDQRLALIRINMSLANLHEGRHQYVEAEKYHQVTYEYARSLFGDKSTQMAKTLCRLGEIRVKQAGSTYDWQSL